MESHQRRYPLTCLKGEEIGNFLIIDPDDKTKSVALRTCGGEIMVSEMLLLLSGNILNVECACYQLPITDKRIKSFNIN